MEQRALPHLQIRAEGLYAAAFDAWTLKIQESALNRIVCLRDDLPSTGSVDLSSDLPFLGVDS